MTDPSFTPEEFFEWVRTQDQDEEYNYVDPRDCPVARFLRDTGRAEKPAVAPGYWDDEAIETRTRVSHGYDYLSIDHLLNFNEPSFENTSTTFGGIIARYEEHHGRS